MSKVKRAIVVALAAVGLAAGSMGAVAVGTMYHHGAKTVVADNSMYHHG